jgi:Protein of unknown function (DUF2865)
VARFGVFVRSQRAGCALTGAALMVALSGAPASAQGIFDFLFGGFKRLSAPTQSYVDPNQAPASNDGGQSRDFAGGGPYFCVRMCDGRYFPIGNRAGASAVELCRSFCPSAPTQIFSGSKIDHSIAPGGRRYSEIPNAFVYREKLVADCTCDGKSATGLVRLDPRDDPTLRPGDFVATGQGLMAYRGGNGSTTEFSAISNVPGISPNLRAQLSATRVSPGKQIEDQPDPEADGEAMMSRNVDQRSQAAR